MLIFNQINNMNSFLGYNKLLTNSDSIVPKLNPYFHFTYPFRILPSLFIIGVQKGGTTSLVNYLNSHPQIITAQRKDVFYFNNAIHYAKGINWYKAHFALSVYKWLYDKKKGTNAITFDGTPNYFDEPMAAQRLHETFPQAKLVLLLRNPIERAWSNYQMAKRFGFEELSFKEALDLEQERLDAEVRQEKNEKYHNYIYQRLTYKRRGVYINYLKNWTEKFPSKQLLIIKSEDLFENAKETYARITDFIGIDRDPDLKFEIFNKGNHVNEIDPNIREELRLYYEPFNKELYDFIGVDYGWK